MSANGKEPSPETEIDPELLKEVEERAKEVGEQCKKEMDEKFSHLEKTLKDTVETTNVKMRNVSERYQTHRQSQITTKQTDVLRTNKVLRDVARDLGTDWKEVFKQLMKEFDPNAVQAQVDMIEQQKPFMQAYKALNTWKENMGGDFQLFKLVDVLNDVGRRELGDKVMEIMDNEEIDALYSMSNVGSGIKSGTSAHGDGAKPEAGAAAPASTEAGQTDVVTRRSKADRSGRPSSGLFDDFSPVQGLLSDTTLLKVSRKISSDWETLGKGLGVPQTELDEIKESEGADSPQGAFKMLWAWRNSLGVVTMANVAVLKGALKKQGKNDVAAILDAS